MADKEGRVSVSPITHGNTKDGDNDSVEVWSEANFVDNKWVGIEQTHLSLYPPKLTTHHRQCP